VALVRRTDEAGGSGITNARYRIHDKALFAKSPDRLVECADQHHRPDNSQAAERMEEAAENLRRILRSLRAFERKPKMDKKSTAGTWRSMETFPQITTQE
jgi:uncharacterized membrane protein YccC